MIPTLLVGCDRRGRSLDPEGRLVPVSRPIGENMEHLASKALECGRQSREPVAMLRGSFRTQECDRSGFVQSDHLRQRSQQSGIDDRGRVGAAGDRKT